MAQKRMFDRAIIDTDKFMDLSMSSKALYFLLGMEADDEGFVSYKKVMRVHGGNEDDIKVLIVKQFLIQFESGVVVITDWNTNNYLDRNRIRETEYQKEKKLLLTHKGKYEFNNGSTSIEEYSIEESRIEESIEVVAIAPVQSKRFIKPTEDEIKAYCLERSNSVDFRRFFSYYESNGWRVGKNPMKDWKACVRTWERSDTVKKPENVLLTHETGDILNRIKGKMK